MVGQDLYDEEGTALAEAERALAERHHASNKFFAIMDEIREREAAGKPIPIKTQQDMLQVLSYMLRDHAGGKKKKQLHVEAALFLHITIETLLAGHDDIGLKPSWRGPGKAGKHKHPIHRSCIEDAVIYIRAARAGIVRDKDPIQTALENYGGADTSLHYDTVRK